jgi:ribosomal protein S27AE
MPLYSWCFLLKEGPRKERRNNILPPRRSNISIRSTLPLSLVGLGRFWGDVDGREKLATLKYYSVDSDGKIQRLRRECPSETCGAGIFMAFHEDRQYCGKCHTTCMSFCEVLTIDTLEKDDDE